MEVQKRTWAEISLDHLEHNYRVIRDHIPKNCRFAGVVKADAYGHGAITVSRCLTELGADYLTVACLSEAMELRQAGITAPVLILGYTDPAFACFMAQQNITQEVHSLEYAALLNTELAKTGAVLQIHLKLDTGMGRIGFYARSEEKLAEAVAAARMQYLSVEGAFTHFSVSDSRLTKDMQYTKQQYSLFADALSYLGDYGIHPEICHCCNSGGTQFYPEYHLDMVRPGIMLYGYPPVAEGELALPLKPVMSVKTRIIQIKEYPVGTDIGYGRTFTTTRPTKIAVLTVGYADGLSRLLSGKVEFLIRGHAAPQVGTICMDLCMVDVTHLPCVSVGDEAVLIGSDGSLTRTAEDLARQMGTISYEVLCGFQKRVARIPIRHGARPE